MGIMEPLCTSPSSSLVIALFKEPLSTVWKCYLVFLSARKLCCVVKNIHVLDKLPSVMRSSALGQRDGP